MLCDCALCELHWLHGLNNCVVIMDCANLTLVLCCQVRYAGMISPSVCVLALPQCADSSQRFTCAPVKIMIFSRCWCAQGMFVDLASQCWTRVLSQNLHMFPVMSECHILHLHDVCSFYLLRFLHHTVGKTLMGRDKLSCYNVLFNCVLLLFI